MKESHSDRVRRKHMRSRAKWAMLILLVLIMGIVVEFVRLELGNHAVAVTAPFRPQYSANEEPYRSIDLVKKLSGIDVFAARYGTAGRGQRVAIIDSGIDLSHEVFADTTVGLPKVAAYYDYTDEGLLYTVEAEQDGDKISVSGTCYRIGSIYNEADVFYLSFLNLDTLEPKLIDGMSDDLAVLVLASGLGEKHKVYDCIYLDTNRNGDFTDEVPMRCYQDGGDHTILHHTGYPIDIALTEIDPAGKYVKFTADTLGHGTFLASVIAGNGDRYQGIAPEAQLYVYKIFDRNGASSQQRLVQAIRQAIADKVDCINLSLSIPKEERILSELRLALQEAQASGIFVVAAAGNLGPGKDTLSYPAREHGVIGIGSVAYPEQYLLDRAVYLEECFIPDYSGRGRIDGSKAPLLTAPSGVLAAVPGWYKEQYMYDYGTSISAAVVTGGLCHLQESMTLDAEQLIQLLAVWAQDLGAACDAQGYGAFQLGELPQDTAQLSIPQLRISLPQTYTLDGLQDGKTGITEKTAWHQQYNISQGQAQSWYFDVPEDAKALEVSFVVNTEPAGDETNQLIAMGRCRMYVYRPDGTLAEATEYIGASYGNKRKTGESVTFRYPQKGVWEVVIVSADNLSVYQHFESKGMLYVSVK